MDRDSIIEPSFDATTTSLDEIRSSLTSGQSSVEARATDYDNARRAHEARVAEAEARITDPAARIEYATAEREALDEAGRVLRVASSQAVADAQAVVRALEADRTFLTPEEQAQAGSRSTTIALQCEHFPIEQVAAQMAEALRANDRPAMSLFLAHAGRIPQGTATGTRDGTGRVLFGDDTGQSSNRAQVGPLLSQMRKKLRDSRQDETQRLSLAVLAKVRKAEQAVVAVERERVSSPGARAFGFQTGTEVAW